MDIHLILDNYSTRKTPRFAAAGKTAALRSPLPPRSVLRGSAWSSAGARPLTEKQLRRGVHRSTRGIERAIQRYLAMYNEQPKPSVWTKTVNEILTLLARSRNRISSSGHKCDQGTTVTSQYTPQSSIHVTKSATGLKYSRPVPKALSWGTVYQNTNVPSELGGTANS